MAKLMVEGTATVSGTDYTLRDTARAAMSKLEVGSDVYNNYNGSTQSGTSDVDISGCSKTITTHGGPVVVFASVPCYQSGGTGSVKVWIDGVLKGSIITTSNQTSKQAYSGMRIYKNLPAGEHTFKLTNRPQSSSYTAYVSNYTNSCLCVFELPVVNGDTNMLLVPTDQGIEKLNYALMGVQDIYGELLWTNTNPTASFVQQDIAISNLNDYVVFDVYFQRNTTNDSVQCVRIYNNSPNVTHNYLCGGSCVFVEPGTTMYHAVRNFGLMPNGTPTHIHFYPGWLNTSQDDTRAIPRFIVGHKKMFSDVPAGYTAPSEDSVRELLDAYATTPASVYNYSTNEQVVGTWIDGKPLYRKCFLISSQDTYHNISNLDYTKIVSAMVYDPNFYGARDVSNDIIFQSIKFWLTGNALSLVSNGIKLIVEYTKTS